MSNGTKVVVTGSSGFIGSHVLKALELGGYTVYGYDLKEKVDDLHYGNILYRDFLENTVHRYNPAWIIHLAGQVFLQPSLEKPQMDARTNIIGTLNVLETARKTRCGVVFSSTGAVYGNNYQYPEPISPYGISKLTAEKYCELYHRLYNLHTVVFRFSSVYGSGRKKTSVNLIIDKALKGEVIQVTGDGWQTRDFTHVSDVVEAIVMAVEGKFPSGVYDIGTGSSVTLNSVIDLIGRLLNKKIKVKYVPPVEGDPKRNVLNVSKAEMFGFKAKVSLIDGLKQLIEEMK